MSEQFTGDHFTWLLLVACSGAQSDSEVQDTSGVSEVSDRGYTSDSELYEGQNRQRQQGHHHHPVGLELRPVPDNSSWMMVSLG